MYRGILFGCLLLLLAGQTHPALAGKRMQVDLQKLAPTQNAVGVSVAELRVNKWQDAAKDEGISLQDYALRVLVPRFSKGLIPAVVDWKGRVLNTDGHHRVYALRKVSALTGVRFSIGIDVVQNFEGLSRKVYQKKLARFLGYSKKEVRALPASFDDLKDSPMRSLIGIAFKQTGIRGSLFVDRIQFTVGEMLLQDGLVTRLIAEAVLPKGSKRIPSSLVAQPNIQTLVQRMIFSKGSKVLKYLEGAARSRDTRKQVRESLRAARHQVDRHQFPKLGERSLRRHERKKSRGQRKSRRAKMARRR